MNDDDVIICCLVSTSLMVTWHLQMPLSFSFLCDVVLAMLAVLVVGMGDGCGSALECSKVQVES